MSSNVTTNIYQAISAISPILRAYNTMQQARQLYDEGGVYNVLFPKNQTDSNNTQQESTEEAPQASAQTTTQQTSSQNNRRNYGFTPESIQGQIVTEAYRQGVDPALALAIAQQESGFNPNAIGDNGQSYGLFQIYSPAHPNYTGRNDVASNIQYGVGFLRQLLNQFDGDLNKTIMAYNAGAGAVNSGNIPASTRQTYLPNVMNNYNRLNGNTASTPVNVGNTQTLNERAVGTPITRPTTSGNENIYLNNLLASTGQPDALNQFLNNIRNIQGNNGGNMATNDNNLLRDINIISNLVGGAQQGYQTPNTQVTPEQVQAYMNAINVAGQNLAGIEEEQAALQQAALQDRKTQDFATMLNAARNAIGTYSPNVNASMISPRTGLRVSVNNAQGNQTAPVTTNALEQMQQNAALNQIAREARQQIADNAAGLVDAIQTADQTGLPVSVTRNMEAQDYINYINRLNQERGLNTREGLQAARELLTGRQANEGQLADRQLQNQGDMATTIATQLGNLSREQMSQMGQNQRQAAELAMQREIAQMDNNTRLMVTQLTGINAQELQRLRQQDPTAYLQALSQFVEAGAFVNSPYAQQLFNAGAQTTMGNPNYVNPQYATTNTNADGSVTPNYNMIEQLMLRRLGR